MSSPSATAVISVMLAVPDTPAAVEWYKNALGAKVLWSLGSVAGLEVGGAPFFLHEPVKDRFVSPKAIGATTARVEFFVDEPDKVIARAVEAGAVGGGIKEHPAFWGAPREGGGFRPLSHRCLVVGQAPPAA